MSTINTFSTIPSVSSNPLTDDATGAKAIEVAAMLGDSVVDVKHCLDPKSGKITSKTWGLAAAGISAVLLSAVAFATSVKTAAHNKQALDYWTRVQHRPVAAFRAERLSFGYDWLAFGGFAFGMGALAGSLSRMRRERRSPYYRIGTAADVQQPVIGAPNDSFPLVAPSTSGDDFVMHFGVGMTGETIIDGKAVQLAELAASGQARASATVPGAFELPITLGSRIQTKVGQTSFVVSGVAKPKEQPNPLFAGLESRKMMYVAGSLAAHLGVVFLLSQVPVDDSSAPLDISMLEPTEMRMSNIDTETTPPEKKEEVGDTGGQDSPSADSMKLQDPGQAGDKKAPVDAIGQLEIKNNDVDPQLARQQAVDAARDYGILGSASALRGANFAELGSTADFSSGFDNADQWGAIYGADGTGYGSFGYGRTGFGVGCGEGCGGDGIIGTNGYGKIGMGKFGRTGYGIPGGGGPNGPGHHAKVPPVTIGQPEPNGDMDPAIIRRYIRRNIEKISYCYEKQLLAHPGIEGTIKAQFFISPTGAVKTSTGSGFDSEVSSCVAEVIGSIEFPKPKNGGGVQVNYPFTFHAAGH